MITEKKKEAEQGYKFHNPSLYWKGKKIVSLNEWLKIKNIYGLNIALKHFPNDFPRSGFTFMLSGFFLCSICQRPRQRRSIEQLL
jgi:hypothetical protein